MTQQRASYTLLKFTVPSYSSCVPPIHSASVSSRLHVPVTGTTVRLAHIMLLKAPVTKDLKKSCSKALVVLRKLFLSQQFLKASNFPDCIKLTRMYFFSTLGKERDVSDEKLQFTFLLEDLRAYLLCKYGITCCEQQ